MGQSTTWLGVGAALGCGLNAGVFFAFSSFVMPAFARLPPARGMLAMQAVNQAAPNPLFMSVLFGTAALCVAVAQGALRSWSEPGAPLRFMGSVLYLAGAIVVTITRNVPLNQELAAVLPDTAEGASLWAHYLQSWCAWNHVRSLASLAAALLLTLGLRGCRLPAPPVGTAVLAMLGLTGCTRDELHPLPPPGGTEPASRLSELGLFAGTPAAQSPGPGLAPYYVNVSTYADHAGVLWDLDHTSRSGLPICRATDSVTGRDRVLVPGRPELSAFLARMASADSREHMPRGLTRLVDAAGLALLTQWVAAMPTQRCP